MMFVKHFKVSGFSASDRYTHLQSSISKLLRPWRLLLSNILSTNGLNSTLNTSWERIFQLKATFATTVPLVTQVREVVLSSKLKTGYLSHRSFKRFTQKAYYGKFIWYCFLRGLVFLLLLFSSFDWSVASYEKPASR